ncbi:MAG TPA: 3-hydroxyacyl-ACP dehydratase [Clostridiales bacterium]|nr:3-hydroxyacyl-ACP dehydratase [Clostridiales bacterium]
MVGYVCKYTPIHIIESFGEKVHKIDPLPANFDNADCCTHNNMCSYVKAVLEECLAGKIQRIVLMNCCDSVRRLYDVLKLQPTIEFLYMLDLPRKADEKGCIMLAKELNAFIKEYEKFSGINFNKERFVELLHEQRNSRQYAKAGVNIGIMGARCESSITEIIQNAGANIVFNLACNGDNVIETNGFNGEDIIYQYAKTLLNQYPCMRMADTTKRYAVLKKDIEKSISGLIFHTVKFCDMYSFDYTKIKENLSLPVLKLETDYSLQSEGQIRTRIEAFIEALKTKKPPRLTSNSAYVCGIDSGSLSTNVVILDGQRNILAYSIVPTGAKTVDSATEAFENALARANLTRSDISYIVSTGYGRIGIPFSDKRVTEITCHGRGAHFLNNSVRTIIDIGGQDSKIIRINNKGDVVDFVMNDKCSAGTGRFLEVMAKTLGLSLEDMSKEAANSKEELTITSMCTVFAESEVISLIAKNKDKADIIKGLNKSIAGRTLSLLERIGRKKHYMMTGGVAKNSGVVQALEEKIGEKIFVPEEPQIIGALGAALIALENIKS